MSGMKFRLECAKCGATFYAENREAQHCLKCERPPREKSEASAAPDSTREPRTKPEGERRRFGSVLALARSLDKPAAPPAKAAPRQAAVTGGSGARSTTATAQTRPLARPKAAEPAPAKPAVRAAKATEITAEQRAQIIQIFQETHDESTQTWREIVGKISDSLWIARFLVSQVLQEHRQPSRPLTPELAEQAIAMYRAFVERRERPPQGRRRTIASTLDVSLTQVRDAIHRWAQMEFDKAPTRQPSREQLFLIEQRYFAALQERRLPYQEFANDIADQLQFVSHYQVLRWLDMLHDDLKTLSNVPNVEPAQAQRIRELYQAYLSAPAPPDQGLHKHLADLLAAEQLGEIAPQQVYKVLLAYRHECREQYLKNNPS